MAKKPCSVLVMPSAQGQYLFVGAWLGAAVNVVDGYPRVKCAVQVASDAAKLCNAVVQGFI